MGRRGGMRPVEKLDRLYANMHPRNSLTYTGHHQLVTETAYSPKTKNFKMFGVSKVTNNVAVGTLRSQVEHLKSAQREHPRKPTTTEDPKGFRGRRINGNTRRCVHPRKHDYSEERPQFRVLELRENARLTTGRLKIQMANGSKTEVRREIEFGGSIENVQHTCTFMLTKIFPKDSAKLRTAKNQLLDVIITLTKEEEQEFNDFLENDLADFNDSPGLINIIKHVIKLKNGELFKQRFYPRKPVNAEATKVYLQTESEPQKDINGRDGDKKSDVASVKRARSQRARKRNLPG
ncbi:hypothetical protein J6590_036243 [Homalodisca vitripennis]|nr:hypothetical protein J6590_036243 [Homalodisca vitripennis]